jgi:transcriptional regulator with XRE-family HTH domain
MTPAQSRAARGLIDWSQTELATHSNLSESTIRDFEKGRRQPSPNNLGAIQRALEAAGVEFTNGDRPGVRMQAKPPNANDGVPKGWTMDPAEADRHPLEPAAAPAKARASAPKRSVGSQAAPHKSSRPKRR